MKKLISALLLLAVSGLILARGHRVLFIGDSITDGAWGNSKIWNASSDERNQYDMNHIYGHGYMMIIASHYEALYPDSGYKFWNRGISGNTLNDLAARWQKDVLDLNPDVVSILIGTNDVDKALREGKTIDTREWGDTLRHLLDSVKQQNADTKFVLCTPFVAKVGKIGDNENYPLRKSMVESLAEEIGIISIEYNATLVKFDKLVDEAIDSTPSHPASYWIWDGIHPTPAMHYRMANLWMECAGKEVLGAN